MCLWSCVQASNRGPTVPFHFPPLNAPREDTNEIIDVETLWEGPQQVLVGEGTETGLDVASV